MSVTEQRFFLPCMLQLLERCTEKLKLNMAARRIFLSDGTEASEPKDIPRDADIYISSGESFIDPLKNVKGTEKCVWL